MALEPGDSPLNERRRCHGFLVRQYLGVGDPRGIVDAYMQELPAHTPSSSPAIPVDPVPDALDTPELLRVQVQQLTRSLLLVAHHDGLRLDVAEPAETQAPEPKTHRRDGQLELLSDPKTRRLTPIARLTS